MARKAAKKATKKKAVKKEATKKKATMKKGAPAEMIISKSRTKNSAGIRVSSEFYAAFDAKVREILAGAEERATANNRGTLRPHDL